jgi:hypothetical protein
MVSGACAPNKCSFCNVVWGNCVPQGHSCEEKKEAEAAELQMAQARAPSEAVMASSAAQNSAAYAGAVANHASAAANISVNAALLAALFVQLAALKPNEKINALFSALMSVMIMGEPAMLFSSTLQAVVETLKHVRSMAGDRTVCNSALYGSCHALENFLDFISANAHQFSFINCIPVRGSDGKKLSLSVSALAALIEEKMNVECTCTLFHSEENPGNGGDAPRKRVQPCLSDMKCYNEGCKFPHSGNSSSEERAARRPVRGLNPIAFARRFAAPLPVNLSGEGVVSREVFAAIVDESIAPVASAVVPVAAPRPAPAARNVGKAAKMQAAKGTVPCRNFAQGHCGFGDKCNFSHARVDVEGASASVPAPVSAKAAPTPAEAARMCSQPDTCGRSNCVKQHSPAHAQRVPKAKAGGKAASAAAPSAPSAAASVEAPTAQQAAENDVSSMGLSPIVGNPAAE